MSFARQVSAPQAAARQRGAGLGLDTFIISAWPGMAMHAMARRGDERQENADALARLSNLRAKTKEVFPPRAIEDRSDEEASS